ncbi:MAG TPA: C2H2-type zinc finger protein [Nitrososphaeraceae archaeon]|jgi:hypothetical protein
MQPTTNPGKPLPSSLPSSNSSTKKRDWISMINESVHTSDDVDIGDVYAVSKNLVVVMRGLINIHYYYIPVSKVEGWDGNVLWLKVTENQVKDNYERDIIPDPRRYYIKDYTYYRDISDNYFLLPLIPPRYVIPAKHPEQDQDNTKSPPASNLPIIYTCDLCNKPFNSQDELDKHMEDDAH